MDCCPHCGLPLNDKPIDPYDVGVPTSEQTVIDYDFTFRFGKYIHRTVREVLADNPSYIVWVAANLQEKFLVDGCLLAEAQRKTPTPRQRRSGPNWSNADWGEDDYDYYGDFGNN